MGGILTWPTRILGKVILSLYIADLVIGITIAFFAHTMNAFVGLLMVLYAAMPWMLIIKYWPEEPHDWMRAAVLIGGLVLNFILLSMLCRWLDRIS